MSKEQLIQELLQLSDAERIAVREAIDRTVFFDPHLNSEQNWEMNRRLDLADCEGAAGSPWPEVRDRILSRAKNAQTSP